MLIKYLADVRLLTGCSEQQWNKVVPTLGALLRELTRQYGPAFEKRVLENGEFNSTITIFLNGRNAVLSGLDTRLNGNDLVVFFPMIAGD